jgi:hypothetical protein
MKKIETLLMAVAWSLLLAACVTLAYPHEGDYKHQVGYTDPMIGMRDCGYHTVITTDVDGDGIPDNCTGVFLYHDELHVIPVEMIVIDGKLQCGCDAMTIDNGGIN